jgi:hypothetical protein
VFPFTSNVVWLDIPNLRNAMHPFLLWLPLASFAAGQTLIQPRQASSYGSCKEISFSHPAWYLWDPTLVTINGTTIGDFGVGLQNTANGGDFICLVESVELAPDSNGPWYNCSIPTAKFRPNLTTNSLEFSESWVCEDDPT